MGRPCGAKAGVRSNSRRTEPSRVGNNWREEKERTARRKADWGKSLKRENKRSVENKKKNGRRLHRGLEKGGPPQVKGKKKKKK